jgi:hypothetical protein
MQQMDLQYTIHIQVVYNAAHGLSAHNAYFARQYAVQMKAVYKTTNELADHNAYS